MAERSCGTVRTVPWGEVPFMRRSRRNCFESQMIRVFLLASCMICTISHTRLLGQLLYSMICLVSVVMLYVSCLHTRPGVVGVMERTWVFGQY